MVNIIIAGETLEFTESFSEYSAEDYALNIYLRGPSSIDITATQDGSGFDISVPSSTTENWTAGDYFYESYVTDGSNTYRVDWGSVEIKQALSNVSTSTGSYDGRSDIKKTLDAIESVLYGRAGSDVDNYEIAGRKMSKIPIEDLIKLRDLYKNEYLNEQRVEKLKKGLQTGSRISTRFI